MTWTRRDTLSICIIMIIIGAFFLRLFWPSPRLIITPDFGRSDAWNFSFPTKYFLGQEIHAGRIPLWSTMIGNGFPLFAEGQTGTFFLPNLVFFSLFDAITAYNLALVASVITAAAGFYLWLRILGFRSLIALSFGVTVGLSGIIIPQLPHISLLQAFTLMPLVMATTHLSAIRPSWRHYLLFSVLLGQQILTGFPQGIVVTLCFSIPYYGFLIWKEKKKIAYIARYVTALIFALLLGAIQLLPSYEFLQQIITSGGFSLFSAAQYSFPVSHLSTFYHPFALGNPKFGTYAFPNPESGSIFWENSGYIGILPLICIIFIFIRNRKNKTIYIFFILAALTAFLLMLGRSSPLYILFSFWPLNLFRVPSRFIWIFVLSILVLSAYGLTRILQFLRKPLYQYILMSIFLFLQTAMLVFPWRDYHQFERLNLSYKKSNEKTLGIGLNRVYFDRFITEGWQNANPYTFLQTSYLPDANLLTGIKSHDVYAGRQLRRSVLFDSILFSEIQQDKNTATISAQGKKLLDIAGITTLYSSTPVTGTGLTLTETHAEPPFTVYIYENNMAIPRAYLASSAVTASTREEAQKKFFDDLFISGETVLLERDIPDSNTGNKGIITIDEESETSVSLRVTDHPFENILVLNDTYYPDWNATIDGNTVPIYPANINYRAVVLPQGDHTVRFSYQPKSFAAGAWISTVAWFAAICLMGFPLFSAAVQIVIKARRRDQNHPHNRGT